MNILIVESENDEYFVEALAKEISVANKACKIDDFKHASLDPKKLTTSISDALTEVSRDISKIGIIIDIDDNSFQERINLINSCIKEALIKRGWDVPVHLLKDVNQFVTVTIEGIDIKIACHFTNVDGQGELDTILKAIKTQSSVFADSLNKGWRKSFLGKGKRIAKKRGESGNISEKEILKLWVDFYKRFDTLKRGDRDKHNTDWKGIMLGQTSFDSKFVRQRGKDIFNLNHPKLDSLKAFLQMFN
jgi:hypothetical protein